MFITNNTVIRDDVKIVACMKAGSGFSLSKIKELGTFDFVPDAVKNRIDVIIDFSNPSAFSGLLDFIVKTCIIKLDLFPKEESP